MAQPMDPVVGVVPRQTPEAAALRRATEAYCKTDNWLASLSYFGTFAVYFLTLWAAIAAWPTWWATAIFVLVNGFASVRLYVLQHDTGHNSLFSTPRLNTLAGYGLSTFTLTPFRAMQYNHNAHHAFLGNLDHRDTTEIYTMTVREWQAAGFWQRLYYRMYRNPLLLLPLGGLWTYLIAYRWPKNATRGGLAMALVQNLAVFAWWGLIAALAGWTGVWVYVATAATAGSIGVFLVYLQHNFEDTWWDRKPDLKFEQAALIGSSTLDFGWWFDLGVANITYHALHHFNPRIPSYRLRTCHKALAKEFPLRTIAFPEAVASFRLKLWDEEAAQLVPFAAAEPALAARATA